MSTFIELFVMYVAYWTCGAVFSHTMEQRENFKRNTMIIVAIITVLFGGLYFLYPSEMFVTDVIIKIIVVVLMFLFIYGLWEGHFTTAIYNTVWAVSLWQLLYEAWNVLDIFFGDFFAENAAEGVLAIIGLFAFGHIICAFTIAKWMPADRKKKLGPRQTASAVLIFLIIEMLSHAPSLQTEMSYNENWKFIYLSQLMCIVILYLQNELFKKSDMKQELAIMNLLWKKEQEQYHLTKENIALINQKSHDLKHQIKALRKVSKEEFDSYLDEIEDSVLIYNAIVKTGNDVFDTILTEKSLYCKDRGIQVSCVADGSQLDFINTVDLYTLLGNAMDNAIEAVEKFQEIEKRQIDVMIYRQQNFLVMNIINPVADKIEFDEEELPITTKGDKRYHGFGLRSMRYIVWKYDGNMNVSVEDGCFSIKILIPIPNEK